MQPRKMRRVDGVSKPKPFVFDPDATAHIITFLAIADVCAGLGTTCTFNHSCARKAIDTVYAPRFEDYEEAIAVYALRCQIITPLRTHFRALETSLDVYLADMPRGLRKLRSQLLVCVLGLLSLAPREVYSTMDEVIDTARGHIKRYIKLCIRQQRQQDTDSRAFAKVLAGIQRKYAKNIADITRECAKRKAYNERKYAQT